jgi:hypothetical protein
MDEGVVIGVGKRRQLACDVSTVRSEAMVQELVGEETKTTGRVEERRCWMKNEVRCCVHGVW